MTTKSNLIIVFDLDDTLYNEIDFLESAFVEIAGFLSTKLNKSANQILTEMLSYYNNKQNAFKEVLAKNHLTDVDVEYLLKIYRNHLPNISLTNQNKKLLEHLKGRVHKLGVITDGRSTQQRNKIKALGLADFFDDVIISEEFGSEKPNVANYEYYTNKYGNGFNYVYIGDNTKKDFVAPNALGWTSLCLLDNGKNIHAQNLNLNPDKTPTYTINNLTQIKDLLF
ncbi:HAD family hydrolase [Gelatiniphilus marinus]|uniref:HAD family hydrolase n=1 Tax=Gelatiniphilus marinus TaxID=1759464 RepID=A0ABW5JQD1_9FLAO